MSLEDIIKAWKNADYRESLAEADRALLPQHPAGLIELSDAGLHDVTGAAFPTDSRRPAYNPFGR